MQQLIYVSDKKDNYSKSDTIDVLVSARKRNLERFITGLIVELDNHFFQIIEGSKQDVQDIFNIIQQDPRHQHIRVIYDEPVLKREFGEWAMGYANSIEPQQIDDANTLFKIFSAKESFTEMEAQSIKMLLSSIKGQANHY